MLICERNNQNSNPTERKWLTIVCFPSFMPSLFISKYQINPVMKSFWHKRTFKGFTVLFNEVTCIYSKNTEHSVERVYWITCKLFFEKDFTQASLAREFLCTKMKGYDAYCTFGPWRDFNIHNFSLVLLTTQWKVLTV